MLLNLLGFAATLSNYDVDYPAVDVYMPFTTHVSFLLALCMHAILGLHDSRVRRYTGSMCWPSSVDGSSSPINRASDNVMIFHLHRSIS